MSLKKNKLLSEKCLFGTAVLSSAGCGLWFGKIGGIPGFLSGLVLGFFIPVSILIVITSVVKVFRNFRNCGSKFSNLKTGIMSGDSKELWFVWFTIGAGVGISTGVYLGLKIGIIGVIGGALAGFITYYFITLIVLKIFN